MRIVFGGKEKIEISENINYPSDHFGLMGVFKRK
jgi:hypothetical protein